MGLSIHFEDKNETFILLTSTFTCLFSYTVNSLLNSRFKYDNTGSKLTVSSLCLSSGGTCEGIVRGKDAAQERADAREAGSEKKEREEGRRRCRTVVFLYAPCFSVKHLPSCVCCCDSSAQTRPLTQIYDYSLLQMEGWLTGGMGGKTGEGKREME